MLTEVAERYTFQIQRESHIEAPPAIVFESILAELGPEGRSMDGTSMNLRIEAFPGGRWWRDLGNASWHLWGHVQVIKPPTLIELCGPMFMSYPAINHVQYKLTAQGNATTLAFIHRAFGDIAPDHRKNMVTGWDQILSRTVERAKQAALKR